MPPLTHDQSLQASPYLDEALEIIPVQRDWEKTRIYLHRKIRIDFSL
jgi:hypothetical protein